MYGPFSSDCSRSQASQKRLTPPPLDSLGLRYPGGAVKLPLPARDTLVKLAAVLGTGIQVYFLLTSGCRDAVSASRPCFFCSRFSVHGILSGAEPGFIRFRPRRGGRKKRAPFPGNGVPEEGRRGEPRADPPSFAFSVYYKGIKYFRTSSGQAG